jgi:DoxX-like family
MRTNRHQTRTGNRLLWTAQGLLAALFLLAGGAKLAMPAQALAQATGLSGAFMKFIATAEVLGALGLVLPGLFRIGTALTPVAAAGLTVIMAGATTETVMRVGLAPALFPLAVGLVTAAVACARRPVRVRRNAMGDALQPAH